MSAAVHVYADGSVLISTGGLEMGQGLFTKVKQARLVGPRMGSGSWSGFGSALVHMLSGKVWLSLVSNDAMPSVSQVLLSTMCNKGAYSVCPGRKDCLRNNAAGISLS